MGVMNFTPDSFSDGGELRQLAQFQEKLKSFGPLDAIDAGAESTAPMNGPITADEEWGRLESFLPFLKASPYAVSIDTYHPETMEKVAQLWLQEKIGVDLLWNDVSGKFDHFAQSFLALSDQFHYVFCHNLAPTRALTGKHMDFLSPREGGDFLKDLADYFRPYAHPRVIFDPCLGFSKTFDQNWYVLNHFRELQEATGHQRWLLGFSRKSFLRKRFNLSLDDREELDRLHGEVLSSIAMIGEVWVRTHRPELLRLL